MLGAVGDEEAEGGGVEGIEAFDLGLPEDAGDDGDPSSAERGRVSRCLTQTVNRRLMYYLSMILTETVAVEGGMKGGVIGFVGTRVSGDAILQELISREPTRDDSVVEEQSWSLHETRQRYPYFTSDHFGSIWQICDTAYGRFLNDMSLEHLCQSRHVA